MGLKSNDKVAVYGRNNFISFEESISEPSQYYDSYRPLNPWVKLQKKLYTNSKTICPEIIILLKSAIPTNLLPFRILQFDFYCDYVETFVFSLKWWNPSSGSAIYVSTNIDFMTWIVTNFFSSDSHILPFTYNTFFCLIQLLDNIQCLNYHGLSNLLWQYGLWPFV